MDTPETYSTMMHQLDEPQDQQPAAAQPPPMQQLPIQQPVMQQAPHVDQFATYSDNQWMPPTPVQPVVLPAKANGSWSVSSFVELLTNPSFLKAFAVVFVVFFAVTAFPVEDAFFKYVPALATLPNAGIVVKAAIASIFVTIFRPPSAA